MPASVLAPSAPELRCIAIARIRSGSGLPFLHRGGDRLLCNDGNLLGGLRSRVDCGGGRWRLDWSLRRWLENQQTFRTLLVTEPGEFRNAVDEIE